MVTAAECPRISPAFLREERRSIGDYWYLQEYECQFMDSEVAAFSSSDVRSAFVSDYLLWTV